MQHSNIDKGTPENQVRRLQAAGGDPRKVDLTSNPLDILYAHGQITDDQRRAASDYASLYGKFYRKGTIAAAPLDGAPRGRGDTDAPDDEDEVKRRQRQRARFGKMVQALDDLCFAAGSNSAKSIFDNLVVFQKTPRWMQPVFKTKADVQAGWLFQSAINAIAKVTEPRQRPAA